MQQGKLKMYEYKGKTYKYYDLLRSLGLEYYNWQQLNRSGFTDDEIVEYAEIGKNFYVLYTDDEIELPFWTGYIEELSEYLGIAYNSINCAVMRTNRGERTHIQSKKTGERFIVGYFKTRELVKLHD